MFPSRPVAFSLLLAGALIAGCGGSSPGKGPDDGSPAIVDLEQMTYRGVGIGDTEAKMKAVFGGKEPASVDESATPAGAEDSPGPVGFNPFPGDIEPRWFRYDEVSFFVAREEIVVVMVADPAAKTDKGVAMGDDLDAAQAEYGLSCGIANENTEYEPYPACAGELGPRRHVWFGGDPIENITFGTVDLWGV